MDAATKLDSGQEQPSAQVLGPITAAVAAAAVGLAVDQALKALDEERSHYAARFSSRFVGEFYKVDGTPRYRCLSIERKVGVGKQKRRAMFFLAGIDYSPDGTAMQFYPIALAYPKLKAKALRWFDETADVVITFHFASTWKDSNGFHNQPTGSVAFYKDDLQIGFAANVENDKSSTRSNELGWLKSDWMTPIVPSDHAINKTETGNFSMTATVMESTETGADLVGLVAEALRANKGDVVNVVISPNRQ